MRSIIFLGLIFLSASCQSADVNAIDKIDIYFVNWSIRLRTPLTVDEVRERYDIHVILKDEARISELVENLPLSDLEEASKRDNPIDIRLVVDVHTLDGTKLTYFASQFFFYGSNGELKANLPPAFGKTFGIAITFP